MSEIQDIVELKLSVKSPTPNFPYNDDAGNHDPGFPTICYFHLQMFASVIYPGLS